MCDRVILIHPVWGKENAYKNSNPCISYYDLLNITNVNKKFKKSVCRIHPLESGMSGQNFQQPIYRKRSA